MEIINGSSSEQDLNNLSFDSVALKKFNIIEGQIPEVVMREES